MVVVVVVYAPDAQYEEGSTEGNYSQRLGERAKASGKGVTADKWKPKSVPPKPTAEQVKHPKRLLWADLEMHLRHYAYCKNTTLILMGDLNTDVVTKKGKDESELVTMMDKLRLTSCAAAAWPESHIGFKTWHKGGRATHIDYILMTSTSVSALRRFGIHRNEDFPSSIDHSSMFIDIDAEAILGVTTVDAPRVVTRSKSQIRYGDKPRVARFREFADGVLAKERLGERMEKLIGTLSLTHELKEEGARDREEEEAKGWGEVNWSATEAEADSGKGGMDYVEGMALRQRINAAMALLDHVAARADLAFAQTHGGDSRVRSKSNQNRWGDGYSAVAKRAALVCTRLRKLVKSVYKQRLDDADAIRAILASDGVDIGDVHREAGVVVSILSFRKPPIRGSVTNCVDYFGDPSHRSVGLKWARRAGGSEAVAKS